jgi:uncharacterized protein involved in response to NO
MNEQFFLLLAALGFVAAGPSALWPARLPYAVGVHVWAVGSIGLMTLAMMTRATLGHTGRALVEDDGLRLLLRRRRARRSLAMAMP